MKLGSLFDGSGGFPLAGTICGITPVWASEIEPYPISVTKARFPEMKHLGSITQINGAEIEPVDVITFGSPCQDLSVAGKQKGIHEGERSNLFFEAIRIIHEMREATDHRYPRYAVWENVPGAFSSNKGHDFRAVLQAFCDEADQGLHVPLPQKGKWQHAGCVVGDGFSVAWRQYDAQFWGVPQRRKRIYLIADFASERAGEILFEREGVRGYFTQGRTPWQGAASDTQGSTAPDDREGESAGDGSGRGLDAVKAYSFDSLASNSMKSIARNGKALLEQANPICASDYKDPDIVAYLASGKETVGTLMANAGTKLWLGNQEAFSGDYHIVEESQPPVRYIVRRLTPLECCRLQGFPDCWGDIDVFPDWTDEDYHFWLNARNTHAAINGKTVKEYTEKQMVTWYNELHTDSAECKMWGNGIALPCAVDVLSRLE